jgi:hypothetical protein
MARTIGKTTVLPDLPPRPNMAVLPAVNLTQDTLAGHNATRQGLTANAPRPAAPVVNAPQFAIPDTLPLPIENILMGSGFGQGIVPMSPRPAAPTINVPRISLPGPSGADYDISSYSLTGQNITPENQYARPSHTQEIYGDPLGNEPDVSQITRVNPATLMPSVNAHQPTETFGNNPAWETARTEIRPTNPRTIFGSGPQINIPASEKKIALRDRPIIPAPMHNPFRTSAGIGKLVGPVQKIRVEAKPILPPVRNADMGGLLSSTSTLSGNFHASGIGRAFGAEAQLTGGL